MVVDVGANHLSVAEVVEAVLEAALAGAMLQCLECPKVPKMFPCWIVTEVSPRMRGPEVQDSEGADDAADHQQL